MKKLFLIGLFSSLFILGACGAEEETEPKAKNNTEQEQKIDNSESNQKASEEVQETPKEDTVTISWQEQIKKIATSDKSETEKHDEVMQLVGNYQPTEDEIKQFEEYIKNEFTNGKYLSDIKNHEYMLNNLFQSGVVEEYYDDSEQNPMDDFAFDFLQNTKYTYRGVDTVDSESVKSNEEQMKKALGQ